MRAKDGLAAASVLARNGLEILVLEKTKWPGVMVATKELFESVGSL